MGFIGLGVMGQPMAQRLAQHLSEIGDTQDPNDVRPVPLVVWNRTPSRAEPLRAMGAEVASSLERFWAREPSTVFLMLLHEEAMDAALARRSDDFTQRVAGRVIVSMGTFSPEWSAKLAVDVAAAGGRFVELPVSGSRVPAERGELIGLAAGDPQDVDELRPLLAAFCREVVHCGQPPAASFMKLAVNVFLITQVTGLAESFHLAQRLGLDLQAWQHIVDVGPMASAVSRGKAAKLVARDFSVQAGAADVLKNCRLIAAAAEGVEAAVPSMLESRRLFEELVASGHGDVDMAGVALALDDGASAGRIVSE